MRRRRWMEIELCAERLHRDYWGQWILDRRNASNASKFINWSFHYCDKHANMNASFQWSTISEEFCGCELSLCYLLMALHDTRMSLLRPGVIKQHKTPTQNSPLHTLLVYSTFVCVCVCLAIIQYISLCLSCQYTVHLFVSVCVLPVYSTFVCVCVCLASVQYICLCLCVSC